MTTLQGYDGSLHTITNDQALQYSSTLAGLIDVSPKAGDKRPSADAIPIPFGNDSLLSGFMEWVEREGATHDTVLTKRRIQQAALSTYDIDTFVRSVRLADWLGAGGYLGDLLTLLEGGNGARLARVQACAEHIPNMAALLVTLDVPTLRSEVEAQALLGALVEATEADGSALSWPQLQMCDGRYLTAPRKASAQLCLGLTSWAAAERERREKASAADVIASTSHLPRHALGWERHELPRYVSSSRDTLLAEAFQAANDEMWAVFDLQTAGAPALPEGEPSPLDLEAAKAAFARGASVDLYHDSENIEGVKCTAADPIGALKAQCERHAANKVMRELLHVLSVDECEAQPPADPELAESKQNIVTRIGDLLKTALQAQGEEARKKASSSLFEYMVRVQEPMQTHGILQGKLGEIVRLKLQQLKDQGWERAEEFHEALFGGWAAGFKAVCAQVHPDMTLAPGCISLLHELLMAVLDEMVGTACEIDLDRLEAADAADAADVAHAADRAELPCDYPAEWEARVANLMVCFPRVGKAAIVAALVKTAGHAGKAGGEVMKAEAAMAAEGHASSATATTREPAAESTALKLLEETIHLCLSTPESSLVKYAISEGRKMTAAAETATKVQLSTQAVKEALEAALLARQPPAATATAAPAPMAAPSVPDLGRHRALLLTEESVIYLTAVLEYLCAELLELAGNLCIDRSYGDQVGLLPPYECFVHRDTDLVAKGLRLAAEAMKMRERCAADPASAGTAVADATRAIAVEYAADYVEGASTDVNEYTGEVGNVVDDYEQLVEGLVAATALEKKEGEGDELIRRYDLLRAIEKDYDLAELLGCHAKIWSRSPRRRSEPAEVALVAALAASEEARELIPAATMGREAYRHVKPYNDFAFDEFGHARDEELSGERLYGCGCRKRSRGRKHRKPWAVADIVRNGEAITPLMVAAERGDLAMMEWLLDHGAGVNRAQPDRYIRGDGFPFGGLTALACCSTAAAAALLLSRGADARAMHTPPQYEAGLKPVPMLFAAFPEGEKAAIQQLLVAHGANVNDYAHATYNHGQSAYELWECRDVLSAYWPRVVLSGDVAYARWLLERYSPLPNWPFDNFGKLARGGSGLGGYAGCGATVLMLALLTRDRRMAELLLEYGADPNQVEDVRARTDRDAVDPLDYEACGGNVQSLDQIEDEDLHRYLEQPVSTWRIDRARLATPLSVARGTGDSSLVALLTAHGATTAGPEASNVPYLPCCTEEEKARFVAQAAAAVAVESS